LPTAIEGDFGDPAAANLAFTLRDFGFVIESGNSLAQGALAGHVRRYGSYWSVSPSGQYSLTRDGFESRQEVPTWDF
jgi:hypothetical protein